MTKKTEKKTETQDTSRMIRVADVAREHGINPKIARARLRRTFFGTKGTLTQRGIVSGKWEFDSHNLPAILHCIKG